jgi:methylenetetrahydrofolate reductase (NADPH)
MSTLRDKLEGSDRFLVGVELVSTRGTVEEARAVRALRFARELAQESRVDWVSVTDNAGGHPMLAPAALGRPIREAGGTVVVHLSCKDFNRNGLESTAWQLASEGFHDVLALTGDAPAPGVAGGAKPVFDLDSVGLLTLLTRMNAGLPASRPGSSSSAASGNAAGRTLTPTQFFSGCVVTNFKRHENEVIPQLQKLAVKVAAGARWVINQVGYDARKISELIAWTRTHLPTPVPLIGNVYVLNPTVARLFRSQQIPGVVVSDELAALCEEQGRSADRGRAFFLEFAARQVSIYRGLGYRGVYLGGVHSAEEVRTILDLTARHGAEDWRSFAREQRFSRPGEFFCYAEDPTTGLADPTRPLTALAATGPAAADTPVVTPSASRASLGDRLVYRFSKFTHTAMFTPDRGLWKLGERLTTHAADPKQGPGWMRALEHVGKSALFSCRDCGDCSLPDIAFLCPESACAKNQRNGPCGGTRDGLCEVGDFPCIWSRAYDRLKAEGRADTLLAHAPVVQDQSLRGTSSWANTWQRRDHLATPVPPHLATTSTPTNPASSRDSLSS